MLELRVPGIYDYGAVFSEHVFISLRCCVRHVKTSIVTAKPHQGTHSGKVGTATITRAILLLQALARVGNR